MVFKPDNPRREQGDIYYAKMSAKVEVGAAAEGRNTKTTKEVDKGLVTLKTSDERNQVLKSKAEKSLIKFTKGNHLQLNFLMFIFEFAIYFSVW